MSGGWWISHRSVTVELAFVICLAQLTQARAGATGHLAVLRKGPSEQLAELSAMHLQAHLTGHHQPLIGRQLARQHRHMAQLQAHHRQLLNGAAHVGSVRVAIAETAGPQRTLPGRLDGTAARYGPVTVPHA